MEIALISVGQPPRWQLPKGWIDSGETIEQAAVREVREEAGVETEVVELIDQVDYWYVETQRGRRVRVHKFVHFYLLRYTGGNVRDRDHEINEARWVALDDASALLAFKSEKRVVERAQAMLAAR